MQLESREHPENGSHDSVSSSTPIDSWVYVAHDGAHITTLEAQVEIAPTQDSRLNDHPLHSSEGDQSSEDRIGNEPATIGSEPDSSRQIHRARSLIDTLRIVLQSLNLDTVVLSRVEADLNRIEGFAKSEEDSLSDTSSIAPSVLEDYFDKACEIFVAKERLVELDQAHIDLCSGSASDSQQSCDCQIFQPETYTEYNNRRQKLHDQLATAQAELNDLRQACIDQGIEPQLNRFRRVSERSRASNGFASSEYCKTLTAPIRNACSTLTFH